MLFFPDERLLGLWEESTYSFDLFD